MLWVKAFHIIFVASWFAGLFYLPRLFVNLAQVSTDSLLEHKRLLGMANRLYRFSWILMVPAMVLGIILWLGYGIGLSGQGNGWMHAKLLLVMLGFIYQCLCGYFLRQFRIGQCTHKPIFFRFFNEASVLIFSAIVILVVVKPF